MFFQGLRQMTGAEMTTPLSTKKRYARVENGKCKDFHVHMQLLFAIGWVKALTVLLVGNSTQTHTFSSTTVISTPWGISLNGRRQSGEFKGTRR
jgi:hypothetical protein